MSRWLVLAGLIGTAACGHGAKGPAWPTEAKVDEDHPDGGESLEPRHSESVAAVESPGGDDELDAILAAMASDQEAAAVAAPVSSAPAASSEEPITTEEIIIEINDDDGDDGDDD